jgi:hypothetical protein
MAEISRRALLGRGMLAAGAGIGALLGLTRTIHHRVAVPPPAPPAALTAALSRQRGLLAGYDKISSAEVPARAGLRSDVQAHGEALLALLELYPGWRLSRAGGPSTPPAGQPTAGQPTAGQPTSASPPGTAAALAVTSQSAATAISISCLNWPAGEEHAALAVPVLGSIAACLDTHVQVLSG